MTRMPFVLAAVALAGCAGMQSARGHVVEAGPADSAGWCGCLVDLDAPGHAPARTAYARCALPVRGEPVECVTHGGPWACYPAAPNT